MIAAVFLACAAGAPAQEPPAAPAQTPASQSEADLAVHAAGVLAERRDAFVAAWGASSPEGRAAARGPFLARLGFGPGAVVAAPEPVLSFAARLAREETLPDVPLDPLFTLTDALDLRLVPGALPAGTSLDATAIVGWSHPPGRRDLPAEVSLTLALVDAAGAVTPLERVVLRPTQLAGVGAAVRVRIPELAAGDFSLAAEVRRRGDESDGLAVATFRTPVEVVADLAAGLAERPPLAGSPLEQLIWHGVRTEGRPRLRDWFTRPAALPRGGAFAFVGPAPDEPAVATVYVDVPRPADPAGWLAGPEGQPWGRLAAKGVRVVALRLDLGGEGASWTAPRAVLDVARLDPAARRVLVVRADRVGPLERVLGGDGPAFQGVVLLTVQATLDPPAVPGLRPALCVGCLAAADAAPRAVETVPGAGPRSWVRRWAPPPVVERELPALVEAWLPGLLVTVPAVDVPGRGGDR